MVGISLYGYIIQQKKEEHNCKNVNSVREKQRRSTQRIMRIIWKKFTITGRFVRNGK
jgi:hypothetical protein